MSERDQRGAHEAPAGESAARPKEQPAKSVMPSPRRAAFLAGVKRKAAEGLPAPDHGISQAIERGTDRRKADPKHDVGERRDELEDAKKRLGQLDERLGRELAQVGPALTPEQQGEYVHKFHQTKEYRGALAAQQRAERGLEGDLAGGDGAALEKLADHGDGGAQKSLLDSYRALAAADTQGARDAMLWAHQALKDQKLGHHAEVQQILEQAKETFARGLLAELQRLIAGGDKRHLTERLLEAARTAREQLENVKSVVELGNLPEVLHQLEHELTHPLGAKEARRLAGELKGEAPLVRRVATGLFSFAGVAESSAQLGEGELEMLALFRESAEELLQALKGAKRVQQIEQQLAKFAASGGRVTSKVLPLLGVVGGGVATEQDLQALLRSQSVSHITMFVGDLLTTVGAALELAPPPIDLIGGALGVLGGAITAITSLFSGPSQEQKDERAILGGQGGMGLSNNQVSAFTGGFRHSDEFDNSSGYNLQAAQRFGLTPQQIQRLADRAPDLFSVEGALTAVEHLRRWLGEKSQGGLAAGLSGGGRLYAFLEACLFGPVSGAFSRGALVPIVIQFERDTEALGPSAAFLLYRFCPRVDQVKRRYASHPAVLPRDAFAKGPDMSLWKRWDPYASLAAG